MPGKDTRMADGRRAAAEYLRELLLRPGRYRRQWEQYAERTRPGEITQLAVAEVLTHYLWISPRRDGDADAVPRQLKDTVGRALSGRLLSRPALSLFIEAFGFSEQEEDRLWRLWEGSSRINVLAGPRALPSQVSAEMNAVVGPPRHRTLSLYDQHWIGPDGLPTHLRTLHVIEAAVPGLDRIPYICDTDAVTLELGHGCRGLGGTTYVAAPGIYAMDILLVRELSAGETLVMEYTTSFRYSEPPEPVFRRAVRRHAESIGIRVEFHPARLPATVWWTTWDGMGGRVAHQERVPLDSQHSVQRYLRSVENAVAGFRWEW